MQYYIVLGLVRYYVACRSHIQKELIYSIINSLVVDYHLHATCQSVISSFLVKTGENLLMAVRLTLHWT